MIDLGSKINVITSGYASKLGLKICHTNIKVQKIDGLIFKTFEMILASFQVENKLKKACFFEETFLLADISIEVVLEMFFLTFSNADI